MSQANVTFSRTGSGPPEDFAAGISTSPPANKRGVAQKIAENGGNIPKGLLD